MPFPAASGREPPKLLRRRTLFPRRLRRSSLPWGIAVFDRGVRSLLISPPARAMVPSVAFPWREQFSNRVLFRLWAVHLEVCAMGLQGREKYFPSKCSVRPSPGRLPNSPSGSFRGVPMLLKLGIYELVSPGISYFEKVFLNSACMEHPFDPPEPCFASEWVRFT